MLMDLRGGRAIGWQRMLSCCGLSSLDVALICEFHLASPLVRKLGKGILGLPKRLKPVQKYPATRGGLPGRSSRRKAAGAWNQAIHPQH